MSTKPSPAAAPRTAEEALLRRREDEDLGRAAWVNSSRNGLNLAAPTASDLRAIGAKVRAGLIEAGLQADAAVRAAADTATFGLADEMSAGANALLGAGGEGSLGQRYARLHGQEQGTDDYNRKHRQMASGVGEAAMTGATFLGSSAAGSKFVSKLRPKSKGWTGERMSDVRTVLSGEKPINHGKRRNLDGGGHTFTDHQTASGKVVEAKLGPAAGLTPRQRQAQAELGPKYRYDHWSFDDVGRVIGAAVVGAQQGIGRISETVQDTLQGKRQR